MDAESDWRRIRGELTSGAGRAGMGILRVTLLFGSAAIALALFATPFLERESKFRITRATSLDTMSTGSIGVREDSYTIRRSVLQQTPRSVCIIRENGSRAGDC